MTDSDFSRMLKSRRKQLGLTQVDISKRVGVPQSTYSHWEMGSRLPDPERTELPALAEALQLPLDKLLHALILQQKNQGGTQRHHLEQFLSLDDFIAEQQEYLHDSLAKMPPGFSIEIWLIGPEVLPVSQNIVTKDAWISNLNQGINYKIVWLLDLLDHKRQWSVIDDMTDALDEISASLPASGDIGGIYHYPTSAFFGWKSEMANESPLSIEFSKNADLYGTLRGRTLSRNIFYDITLLGRSEMRQKLFRYATALGALAVYCPYQRVGGNAGGKPLATGVAGVQARASFTRQHNGMATATWLEREARDLRTLVVDFEHYWETKAEHLNGPA